MNNDFELIGGCDPGAAWLGLAFLKWQEDTALIQIHDLLTWNGTRHKLGGPSRDITYKDLGACVYELIASLSVFFNSMLYFAMEELPLMISDSTTSTENKGDRTKPANQDVRAVMHYVEQTIRILYPHVMIFYLNARKLKTLFGTGGGGSHADNKKKSMNCTALPPEQMQHARDLFKEHADGIEALIPAMYLRVHIDEELAKRTTYRKPRAFQRLQMTSAVQYPVQKPKRKPTKPRVPKGQTLLGGKRMRLT